FQLRCGSQRRRAVPGASEVFVDTSAWYPIVVRSHPDHRRLADALRTQVAARRRVVTTNLVVAETHALLNIRVNAAAALAFYRAVRTRPNEVVISTEGIEQRAGDDWLERYPDQGFSLTDAVSFVVMKERRISENP